MPLSLTIHWYNLFLTRHFTQNIIFTEIYHSQQYRAITVSFIIYSSLFVSHVILPSYLLGILCVVHPVAALPRFPPFLITADLPRSPALDRDIGGNTAPITKKKNNNWIIYVIYLIFSSIKWQNKLFDHFMISPWGGSVR